MNQNLKNGKNKLILGPILINFSPNLVRNFFLADLTSTRCYTLLKAIRVYNFKEN